MKTAFLCAMILGQFVAEGRESAFPLFWRCFKPSANTAVVSRSRVAIAPRNPAPVAEMTTGNGPTVEGAFLRVATAPKPIQMLNPAAPPEYGSGRILMSFDTDDPNRTANPNFRHFNPRPDGIRFLTFLPANW